MIGTLQERERERERDGGAHKAQQQCEVIGNHICVACVATLAGIAAVIVALIRLTAYKLFTIEQQQHLA